MMHRLLPPLVERQAAGKAPSEPDPDFATSIAPLSHVFF
jgi:hypothetical protein